MPSPIFFADAFNFFLFDGDKVIKPEELSPMDSTEAVMILGKKKNTPVQQHRDLLKLWNAGETEDGVFVLLGLEPQSTIHYGMTVRNMLESSIKAPNSTHPHPTHDLQNFQTRTDF